MKPAKPLGRPKQAVTNKSVTMRLDPDPIYLSVGQIRHFIDRSARCGYRRIVERLLTAPAGPFESSKANGNACCLVPGCRPSSRDRQTRRLPPAPGECPSLPRSTRPPRPHCGFSAGTPGRASAVHSGAMPSRPPGYPTRRTGPGQ